MKNWLSSILAACVLFAGGPLSAADQTVRLSSGKPLDIIGMGPMVSTHGWSALMLKYRTSIPLSNMPALRLEADEIWEHFVVNAEAGRYQSALISANEPAQGFFIQSNDGFNFVFKKVDGSWRTLEGRDRLVPVLDRAYVGTFMSRLDAANDHGRLNALKLYMANDWTLTILDQFVAKPTRQVVDREKFLASMRALMAAAVFRHHRDILGITIDKGGRTAQVASRETTQIVAGSHAVSGTERSVDAFVLQGDIMLWKKSESVIEKATH